MAQCNICSKELVFREPKPGQTWKAFWGCPNYKNHPPKTAPAQSSPARDSNGWSAVAEQLKGLRDEIKLLGDKISKLSILDENPQDFQ